jgi:hypothetical protein
MANERHPVDSDIELLIQEARRREIAPELRRTGDAYAIKRTRDCIQPYELIGLSEAIPSQLQAHVDLCTRCRTIVTSHVPAQNVAAAVRAASITAREFLPARASHRRRWSIVGAAAMIASVAYLVGRSLSVTYAGRLKKAVAWMMNRFARRVASAG